MWNSEWQYLFAQVGQGAQPVLDKGLESAVSFAQSLSQWAYITIGASVALLFKDLSQRPKNWLVRWSFLLFLPAWWFLGRAIYEGVRVHGVYIAYLMSQRSDAKEDLESINRDAASQLSSLKWGLWILCLWLVIYLLWWMGHRDGPKTNESLNRP